MFRHIRTTQELRSIEGSEVKVRAKRRNLPTLYDDIPENGGRHNRSWKKQRRTKYKLVAV